MFCDTPCPFALYCMWVSSTDLLSLCITCYIYCLCIMCFDFNSSLQALVPVGTPALIPTTAPQLTLRLR